ncbi:unnamed protein product [Pylaiella littoralis]
MRLGSVRYRRWTRRCFSSSGPIAVCPARTTSAKAAAAGPSGVLRPYQASVIDRAVELYGQGIRRLLVPLATGLGKTVVFTHLPQAFPELCRRGTLVLVHRDELVQQAVASFAKFLPHLTVGVEKGPETAHAGLDVVVASVQTLGRRGSGATRLRKYAAYGGVVVVDEAHHVKAGGMYDDVLNGLGVGSACNGDTANGRLLAGFTATPRRADGLSLRPFFDHSIGGLDLQWGIANGYLVDIHAYAVRTATDIAALPTRMQDFAGGALSTAVNNDVRNEAAARAMLEFGAGESCSRGKKSPRGIAFCADVRHAHDLAHVLNDHNITAMAVDGGMNKKDRGRALSAFRSGEVSTLTNCGVLTEGFDAPFCDTIVMCRPTQSAPLYMQMIGRGTRPWLPPTPQGAMGGGTSAGSMAPGRLTAIAGSPKPRMHVIDLVDNCGKHKVMSMSTALGLSSEFCGDEGGGLGMAFSVEHVGALAAEAMSLVDADGAAEVGDDCSHPLLEAKTPRELALLVKHYRLLQGAKSGETLLTMVGREGSERMAPSGWNVSQLSVGDRIGKNTFLRVVVETIDVGCEDESEGDECDDDNDFDEFDDFDENHDENDGYNKIRKTTNRHLNRLNHQPRRSPPRRKSKRRNPSVVAGATVHMRHPASDTAFSWRTAGVKDTTGTELHEGASYRLVATVKDVVAGVAGVAGGVEVTRCRLTLVTPDAT